MRILKHASLENFVVTAESFKYKDNVVEVLFTNLGELKAQLENNWFDFIFIPPQLSFAEFLESKKQKTIVVTEDDFIPDEVIKTFMNKGVIDIFSELWSPAAISLKLYAHYASKHGDILSLSNLKVVEYKGLMVDLRSCDYFIHEEGKEPEYLSRMMPSEVKIMAILMQAGNRVVSKEEISRAVFDKGLDEFSRRKIQTYISYLRARGIPIYTAKFVGVYFGEFDFQLMRDVRDGKIALNSRAKHGHINPLAKRGTVGSYAWQMQQKGEFTEVETAEERMEKYSQVYKETAPVSNRGRKCKDNLNNN